ncbi:MAG: ABC transporter permease [Saprospiraceae bacterium]|nr:ABC transporter permease [Saprospiraceae bacterium]
MLNDFPEVEAAVRWRGQGGVIQVGADEVNYTEPGRLFFVDRSVFDVFSFPFVKGNAATALKGLNDIVITESTAKKYFGNAEPIGQTIHYRDEDYTVSAVLKDNGGRIRDNWGWSDYYTYILLKPGADVNKLQAKMPAFAERYKGEDMKETNYTMQFDLQPLKDIHLKSYYDYEFPGNGNFKYLGFLAIAGVLILIIAWINYINLSTARALDRSKEVGIRKVVGAFRHQLIRQFLAESFFSQYYIYHIGCNNFQISLPYFPELVGKEIPGFSFMNWQFWSALAGMFIIGSLLAGFYPAFVMSAFRPIQVLKGGTIIETGRSGNNLLRKVLVVGQFAAAIMLIAGVVGLYRQMQYIRHIDLGVNIDQTLVVQEVIFRDSAALLK